MSYYLACTHCGHYNKLKSATLLFCEKCNKKLPNNFKDWQKQYSDKSFEDYQKEVCIEEGAIPPPEARQKNWMPPHILLWILKTVLLLSAGFNLFKVIQTSKFDYQHDVSIYKWIGTFTFLLLSISFLFVKTTDFKIKKKPD